MSDIKPTEYSFTRGSATVAWPGVEMVVRRIASDRRSGDVTAEAEIWITTPTRALLHRGRVNLLSTRSRAELANLLGKRSPGRDWGQLVEVAAYRIVESSRQGAPALMLGAAQRPAVADSLFPESLLAIPEGDVSICFGDGGNYKSYFCLGLLASLASGEELIHGLPPTRQARVALLDFEWRPWPHRQRLERLWGSRRGRLPQILYIPCGGQPLVHQVERLAALLTEHRIEVIGLDSVALAAATPVEESASAIEFFQALSQLEATAICLAHQNRAGDSTRPFGSSFWANSARATHHLSAVASPDGAIVTVTNRKSSAGPLVRPWPLEISFTAGVTLMSVGRQSAQAAGEQTTRVRMASALAAGPLTYVQLAAALGVSEAMVRKLASQFKGRDFDLLEPLAGSRSVRVGLCTGAQLSQADQVEFSDPECTGSAPVVHGGAQAVVGGSAPGGGGLYRTPPRAQPTGSPEDEENKVALAEEEAVPDLALAEGEEVAPWLSDLPDVAEGER